MTMKALGKPTLNLDFEHSLRFPPRLSFSRAGTLTYRDPIDTLLTAQANAPRVGRHPTNDNMPRGLILAATETVQMPTAGWLKPSVGTMIWRGALTSVATTSILWGISDGTTDNYIRCRMDSSTAGRLRIATVKATTATLTSDVINNPVMAVDKIYSIAVSWDGETINTMVNDTIQGSFTPTGGSPAVAAGLNVLSIGSVISGIAGAVMDGVVCQLKYYPFAATFQQMRGLTL